MDERFMDALPKRLADLERANAELERTAGLTSVLLSRALGEIDALGAALHALLAVGAGNELITSVVERQLEFVYADALGGSTNIEYLSRLEERVRTMRLAMIHPLPPEVPHATH
jgi:hypothetical protein